MSKPVKIIIVLLFISMFCFCTGTKRVKIPDAFIEKEIITDNTDKDKMIQDVTKYSDEGIKLRGITLHEDEYSFIYSVSFMYFVHSDQITFWFVRNKYGKDFYSDIMTVKKEELWPDMLPDKIVIYDVVKEGFSDNIAKIRVKARHTLSLLDYMIVAFAFCFVFILLIFLSNRFDRIGSGKKKKAVTSIFLFFVFSSLVFSQNQTAEQKTGTEKSTRFLTAIEIIDRADFTTNDENFQSGTTCKVFVENYIYIFFAKGNDKDARMFYSQLMKPDNSNLRMCVYNEKYEFVAQIAENPDNVKDDHDITIYCADNSGHTIRKIGTADFDDFVVKVYDTENQIIATMLRHAGTPEYYVEFRNNDIKRVTVLSVIPMVMEIEKQKKEVINKKLKS